MAGSGYFDRSSEFRNVNTIYRLLRCVPIMTTRLHFMPNASLILVSLCIKQTLNNQKKYLMWTFLTKVFELSLEILKPIFGSEIGNIPHFSLSFIFETLHLSNRYTSEVLDKVWQSVTKCHKVSSCGVILKERSGKVMEGLILTLDV